MYDGARACYYNKRLTDGCDDGDDCSGCEGYDGCSGFEGGGTFPEIAVANIHCLIGTTHIYIFTNFTDFTNYNVWSRYRYKYLQGENYAKAKPIIRCCIFSVIHICWHMQR